MNYRNLLSISKIRQALKIESLAIQKILANGYPDICLHFLGGLGDEVMLTCIAHELIKRNQKLKIWQISAAADLLIGNPNYRLVLNKEFWCLRHSNLLKKTRTKLGYSNQLVGNDNWEVPKEHILINSLRKSGVRGKVQLRPYIYLNEEETKKQRYFTNQICIQSVGNNTHETWMKNKLWGHRNFEEVIRILKSNHPSIKLIQIGSDHDLKLNTDLDLRGKTNLRESASCYCILKIIYWYSRIPCTCCKSS
jgi:hypothetical protein